MDDLESFVPDLRDSGHAATSPEEIRYNCAAWTAEDEEQWWSPDEDSDGPEGVARDRRGRGPAIARIVGEGPRRRSPQRGQRARYPRRHRPGSGSVRRGRGARPAVG